MANRRTVLWLALLLLLPVGCSSGASGSKFTLFPQRHNLLEAARDVRQQNSGPLALHRELDKGVQPPYTVEPGDALVIQPVNLDSPVRFPGDQPVLLDGTVNLGRYGTLVVAGKTVLDIEAMVAHLVETQTKDAGPISVRVVTRQSKKFYVLGEVNSPGAFPLQGCETVLDAIIAAGNLTDRASRKDIVLVRPTPPNSCRIVLPICFREIVQLGDTSTNYQLAPGDRIFVASRTFGEDTWNCRHEATPCGCGRPVACTLGAPVVPAQPPILSDPPPGPLTSSIPIQPRRYPVDGARLRDVP